MLTPRSLALLTQHHGLMARGARLTATRNVYMARNVAIFGPKKVIPASMTIAARVVGRQTATPESSITVVGDAPEGFGKQVLWDRRDAGLALVIFLSAADYLGVMISGVRRTDTIEFVSATGIASFAEETKNEGAGAIIGVVAAGATLGASAFGFPEAAPLIAAGAEYAKTQFKEEKVKTKRRDPFGEDPGTGHHARQEGGVVVSLPQARQMYYSGNADHKERWIKEPGAPRDDRHQPAHIPPGFAHFLQAGKANKRTATSDGDLIIYPWDHSFSDNFGSYRLHVLVNRGSGVSPVVD